jgi:hypothetical protein
LVHVDLGPVDQRQELLGTLEAVTERKDRRVDCTRPQLAGQGLDPVVFSCLQGGLRLLLVLLTLLGLRLLLGWGLLGGRLQLPKLTLGLLASQPLLAES